MTARELIEWEVYSSIEPFGSQLADLHNSLLCQVTANCFGALQATTVSLHSRKRGKKPKKYKMSDFALLGRPPKKKQTTEHMLHIVEMLNAALGGKDLRKNNGYSIPR